MNRKSLQKVVVTLVVFLSMGCGLPTANPQSGTGSIKIVNSHVKGSDNFLNCRGLPVTREYGVCFVSYTPDNPAALTKPAFDMILAKDEETTTYGLPPGTYQLQEWIMDSEINQDPLYVPCCKTYVRPPETIVMTGGTTIVFGSERTLTAPGDFSEGNTINRNCGGCSPGGGTPTPTPAVSPTVTPNPTAVAYVGGFAGQWDTNWGDMTCSVDGVAVHCEYTWDEGKIDATLSADGRTMEGQWAESPSYSPPGDGGRVTFSLSEDGNSIDGYWWYGQDEDGGSWTGTRK